MKRFLSLILIAVMMLGIFVGCDTTPKQVEEHTFPDAEYAVNATDLAVIGDKIYYICEEKVYETSSDVVVFEEFPAEYLASNGEALAVYGNGQVWCDGKTYTLPQTEIGSFVYADGTFCCSYMQDDLPQIGFYNIKSGDSISVNPLTGVECTVIPYQGTKILIQCLELSGSILIYDYDTAVMKAGFVNLTGAISVTSYRSEDNTVLLLETDSDARMRQVHLDINETQIVSTCPEFGENVVKMLISGKSAIGLRSDGSIVVRREYSSPLPENKIVTAALVGRNDDDVQTSEYARMRKMVQPLMDKYGIELKFVNYADEDKLKIKLLAGDNDFDIYPAEGYHLRLDYPMYEPLEGYDCITEQFDLMYDEIRQICTQDGHIFGVASRIDVNNNVMQCNDALFEELGLEIPEYGWTYEDFYELKVKAAEYGVDDYPYAIFWPAYYFQRYGDLYETKSLMDDGSALRNILSLMKRPIERSVEVDISRVLFPGDADDRVWFPNSTKHYIVQPSFDGKPHVTASTSFLQMNIKSQNKENTALVMAEYMKMEYNPMDTVGIVFFQEIGDEIRAKGDVASANVDLYLRMLKDYKPYYIHQELLDFANDHYAKYMNDEQDLEYTADQIYTRAKLFFEE